MNTRRNFLKLAGASGLGTIVATNALGQCDLWPTPKQPLGPFYPKQFPVDSDTDLTTMTGHRQHALGERVMVRGMVTDQDCKPIKGAIVEIWQACQSGKYNHPSDTTTTALDPHFQYYGMVRTNDKGEYSFKTIKPGAYLASENWRRPPHIHFKISLRGYKELVTQMYFHGEELNHSDYIIKDLSEAEQKKLIVNFEKRQQGTEEVLMGRFDITLLQR